MTSINGLSGAEVVELNTATVEKRGGEVEKTIAQGRWISDNKSMALPFVFSLTDAGYTMERLEHVKYYDVKAKDVVRLLRENIWNKPAKTPPSKNTWRALHRKVIGNIMRPDVREVLDVNKHGLSILYATHIAYESAMTVAPTLTHGDPTAENVMYRKGYGPVLIDPIEATDTVPDSPCVDVGKMLQSAYGWEPAKYGIAARAYSADDVRTAVKDDAIFRGGQAWAVVHVIRALPYIRRRAPHAIDRVVGVLLAALSEGGFNDEVVL